MKYITIIIQDVSVLTCIWNGTPADLLVAHSLVSALCMSCMMEDNHCTGKQCTRLIRLLENTQYGYRICTPRYIMYMLVISSQSNFYKIYNISCPCQAKSIWMKTQHHWYFIVLSTNTL